MRAARTSPLPSQPACQPGRRKQIPVTKKILLTVLALTGVVAGGCAWQRQPPPSAADQPTPPPPASGDVITVAVEAAPPRLPARTNRSGRPLPLFETRHFVSSGRCANCHDLLTDRAGNDMSIAGHWRATMMANAARDPFWQAKVASEVDRSPHIGQVIQQKCAACHMPMAWTEVADNPPLPEPVIFGAGFLDPANPLHPVAMDGVSCALCHQIADDGLGGDKAHSGKYPLDTAAAPPTRPLYGPYRQPVAAPMQEAVGFTPTYGPQTNDSALCATCHTLFTPFLDEAGDIAGAFPEQTSYLEWRHSSYAPPAGQRHDIDELDEHGPVRLCQECHMPHSDGGGVTIARWAPPETPERDHFSQHHFVGGNVHMLEIMRDNPAQVEATAGEEHFDAAIQRTLAQLSSRTAAIAITKVEKRGERMAVEVQVTNKVGHKFPTGFPSRRAWIHLTVTDAAGTVLFESGRPQPSGAIDGNDNDLDPGRFEPHYQTIDAPDQVQIYEAVMGDSENRLTYTLLRASRYFKDNRLLPAGFDKESAAPEIGVYGAARNDGDFQGGADRLTYLVPAGGPGLSITAELLYTPLSYPFLQDLAVDDHLPPVRRYLRMLAKADLRPVRVAGVAVRLP